MFWWLVANWSATPSSSSSFFFFFPFILVLIILVLLLVANRSVVAFHPHRISSKQAWSRLIVDAAMDGIHICRRHLAVLVVSCSVILLCFILLQQPVSHHAAADANEKDNAPSLFQYRFPTDILVRFRGSRSRSNGAKEKKEKHTLLALGPNITHCSASFSDDDAPVNCCAGVPSFTEEDLLRTAIDFQFPTFNESTIRVRRPVHTITDQDYIERYRRATAFLKNLPITHPHNFARQANMHCMYCTGSYSQANYESMVLKIHRSWMFFPWHRAYLYFHERILGKIMGDDTFALPYWNWDIPEGMHMPDMFMEGPLYHFRREKTHFPPRVTQNDFYRKDNDLGPEEQIQANLALMYVQMVSGAQTAELFMGCPLKPGPEGWCMGFGSMEMYPHNSIHSWTGDLSNPEREDMGAFYSAARDPLFYPHHANIDRLWNVWKDINGPDLEWNDPDWFETFFYFYDENLQLVRVKVRDMLDHTKLGYEYVPSERPWLNSRPKPLVDPKLAKKVLLLQDANNKKKNNDDDDVVLYDSLTDFGPEGRPLDKTFTVRVPRTTTTIKDVEEEEEVLVVYGIDAPEDVDIKFDVFLNIINESTAIAADARAREYAGSFLTMRSGKRMGKTNQMLPRSMRKTTLKLGISEMLRDLEAANDDSIWVTIVPRAQFHVTIEGTRIEHVSKKRRQQQQQI